MTAIPKETIEGLAGLIKEKLNDPAMDPYIDSIARALADSQRETPLSGEDLAEVERLLASHGELERRNAQLSRQNGFLADKNAMLAAAFGACMCWGEKENCANCHGRGRPGFYPPELALLKTLLKPLSRKKDPELRDFFSGLAGSGPAKKISGSKEQV